MRPQLPPLLHEREFARLWGAQTVSLFGDQITLLAVPLTAVLILHAHAAQMGYLTAAELVPGLLFSLHLGAWVDRRGNRRRMMLLADLARAALIATIPIAYAFDSLTLAQLYGVAFLTGSFSILFSVAYSGFFVAVVPRERYVEGNSLVHGSRAFSYVAGPSLGGLLVQLLRAPFALVVDAASFLVSALFLSRVRAVEPATEEAGRGQVTAGLRYIRSSPIVRSCLAATATLNFFNFIFWSLFILYVTRSLHVSPGTLGLVLGAGALGGLIGSFLTGRIGRRIGIGPAFLLGCVLFPAPLVLVPLAGGPRPVVLGLLFLAEFGSGMGVMILDISVGSIFAALIPDRLRSRVSGAYMVVNQGVRPLGSVVGGTLGSTIGLRPTLWIGSVAALAGALWLIPSPIPKLRELPDEAEAQPLAVAGASAPEV